MTASTHQPAVEACLHCQRTSAEAPLINLRYLGQDFWICPQHLPVLIHHPEQLADRLPGAADLPTVKDH